VALAGSVAQLAGCGAGGDLLAGISTGGTGSFSMGPISGLGSIIVNGIRYDDSQALVTRLDDTAGTVGPLKLGMMVSVQGTAISGSVSAGTATAVASRIVYESEWLGPVGAVDPVGRSFTLLGQLVQVSASTIFEGAGVTQLADLSAGTYAEVYGYLNAQTNTLLATRVEVSIGAPQRFRASGVVSNVSGSSFRLGNLPVNFTGAAPIPWSNGSFVRASLQTVIGGDGRWIANSVAPASLVVSTLELDDDDEAEIRGSVSAYIGPDSFAVNGVPVDASQVSNAASLGLAVGSVVKVEGALVNGVVIANKIQLQQSIEIEDQAYEVHGRVEQLDTTARSFVVKGYTFDYDAATVFKLGEAALANQIQVEVKAVPRGGRLYASEVKRDD
jgi:hypothetical protein